MDIKRSLLHVVTLLASTMLVAAPKPQPQHHAEPVRHVAPHVQQHVAPVRQPTTNAAQPHPAVHNAPLTPLARVRLTALQNKQAALYEEQNRFDNLKKNGQLSPGQPLSIFKKNYIQHLHGEVDKAQGAFDKAQAQGNKGKQND